VVPGCLDRPDEVGDGHAGRIEAHGRVLRRVVDGGRNAVEPVQLPLDPIRARSAGHPVQREVDAKVLLGCGRRGRHSAS
jgi:hypothetical protein